MSVLHRDSIKNVLYCLISRCHATDAKCWFTLLQGSKLTGWKDLVLMTIHMNICDGDSPDTFRRAISHNDAFQQAGKHVPTLVPLGCSKFNLPGIKSEM